MVTQTKMLCALLLWMWSCNPQQFSQNREINYSEFLSDTKHASFLVLLCHIIMGYWFPLPCISENSLGNSLVICSKQGTSVIFWQVGETVKQNPVNPTDQIKPTAQFLFLLQNLWHGIELVFIFVHKSSEIWDHLLKNAVSHVATFQCDSSLRKHCSNNGALQPWG